jgi:hypothetical protein
VGNNFLAPNTVALIRLVGALSEEISFEKKSFDYSDHTVGFAQTLIRPSFKKSNLLLFSRKRNIFLKKGCTDTHS